MSTSIQVSKMAVDAVGSVTVSDIVAVDGGYTRLINVYSPPDGNGNRALQFTLQVTGTSRSAIELTAPPVSY